MNSILRILKTYKKHVYTLLLWNLILVIQQGNAQHCTPGFEYLNEGFEVTFDDQSTADGDITTFSWNFGDGGTSAEQNPIHTYASTGTFNVCLTITAHNPGCTATLCHDVIVHGPLEGVCHAAYTLHQPNPDLPIIDFTDQSTSEGTIVSWTWDFGDGTTSTDQNPTHTYAEPAIYEVCLTITDNEGCTHQVCHHIEMNLPEEGVCHSAYSLHQPDPAQPTIDFSDESTSDGTIGSWAWNFGDGNTSTEQNPTHTYAEPGAYTVCLTITDADEGCTDHVCHQIEVNHPQEGNCHTAYSVHQAESEQLIFNFTDQSTSDGIIGTWAWDFGDGSTSSEQNPTHTYAEPGVYEVCLTITDVEGGCTSHVCHMIEGHHSEGSCHAAYVVHQPDQEVPTMNFTDQSTSDGNIVLWNWDFGDGNNSTEQHPTHTYASPGTYLVCLTITDDTGCTSHACHHIEVNYPEEGACHAAYTLHQPNEAEQTIEFTDLSTSDGTIVTWYWEFGDGNTSNDQNPTHTYAAPGNYFVCLSIIDDGGCTSHACHHIEVNHPPADENNSLLFVEMEESIFSSQFTIPTVPTTRALVPQFVHQPQSIRGLEHSENQVYLFAYPNPFTSLSTIQYELVRDAEMSMEMYDLTGNRIIQFNNGKESAGQQTIEISGDQLSAGSYIIRLIVANEVFNQRITVVK